MDMQPAEIACEIDSLLNGYGGKVLIVENDNLKNVSRLLFRGSLTATYLFLRY